jgi:hypothetical protein
MGQGGNQKTSHCEGLASQRKDCPWKKVRKTTFYPEKILLSPLPIKFGCMNCVKVLNKNSRGFLYLHTKFPNLGDIKKVKQGISVGPQIRTVCLMRISKGNK